MTTETAPALSPAQRLTAYWNTLREQKERKTVREILEREVLLCFINTNKDRINEFPLLTPQQRAAVDFLTIRGAADPLHEPVGNLIAAFINLLNKYGGQVSGGDSAGAEAEAPLLLNLESLLLKAVQSVVYTTALSVDNFSEVLIRHYGEEALHPIDSIMETVELGERFWKEHFDHFIGMLADCAYREITANQLYSIRRDKSRLVIRFNFDDILSRLKNTAKSVEKTRAQSTYEESLRTFESRKARKRLVEHLATLAHASQLPFQQSDLPHIARIVCMDPAGLSFENAQAFLNGGAAGATDAEGTVLDEGRAAFVLEQVRIMACTAAFSLNIMRQDFQKSLGMFESKETACIMKLLGTFDLASIERAFFAMLEFQFLSIIRQRAGDDLGKMQLRAMSLRRARVADVDALAEQGMNRIRRNKLWARDPDNEEFLLFAQQLPQDFKAMVEMLHLEPALQKSVLALWQSAPHKVFLLVQLNLDLISRTTTNLNQRLGEIFVRLGTLGPGKKNGTAA